MTQTVCRSARRLKDRHWAECQYGPLRPAIFAFRGGDPIAMVSPDEDNAKHTMRIARIAAAGWDADAIVIGLEMAHFGPEWDTRDLTDRESLWIAMDLAAHRVQRGEPVPGVFVGVGAQGANRAGDAYACGYSYWADERPGGRGPLHWGALEDGTAMGEMNQCQDLRHMMSLPDLTQFLHYGSRKQPLDREDQDVLVSEYLQLTYVGGLSIQLSSGPEESERADKLSRLLAGHPGAEFRREGEE